MKELGVGTIATISGRYYAMDRDQRWERVHNYYDVIAYGQGKGYTDARTGIDECYADGIFDEFVDPVVMVDEQGDPVGKVVDGDSIIFCNFRPDRAIQLSRAFSEPSFSAFERGQAAPKDLQFVSFTQYSDLIVGEVRS